MDIVISGYGAAEKSVGGVQGMPPPYMSAVGSWWSLGVVSSTPSMASPEEIDGFLLMAPESMLVGVCQPGSILYMPGCWPNMRFFSSMMGDRSVISMWTVFAWLGALLSDFGLPARLEGE